MASVYLKFILAFCLLILIKTNEAWESRRDLSSLISILGKKYGSNKQPVIVVVDAQAKKEKPYVLDSSTDTSDERVAVHLSHLMQQNLHDRAKKLHTIRKPTTKSLIQIKENRQKSKLQRLRADNKRDFESKNALRSPLIKKLLRISNSIQCEAKDNCQDKCNNKYKDRKVIKCEMECEVKYDCDEKMNVEPTDPCDEDEGCNSCEGGDCAETGSISTKGVPYEVEDSKYCKRC